MLLDERLINELLKHYTKPDDLIGETGLLKQLTVALLERALMVEMDEPPNEKPGVFSAGGYSPRIKESAAGITVSDAAAEWRDERSRDFRGHDLDEKIVELSTRGLVTHEIQERLHDVYGTQVSPARIASVTSALVDEAQTWQHRPLEPLYPIVCFDALPVKGCFDGRIEHRTVHLAIGVNPEGLRDVLGVWLSPTADRPIWTAIVGNLKQRGVRDIFVACVDGMDGFAEAIQTEYPDTHVQLCLSHLVRHSLHYVPSRIRVAVGTDLKRIYQAASAAEAARNLDEFAAKWDANYPSISQLWRREWQAVAPFFSFPTEVRKAIFTTNMVDNIQAHVRKVTRNREMFASDQAVFKSFHLALRNIAAKRSLPMRDWKMAFNRFAILFGGRMLAR